MIPRDAIAPEISVVVSWLASSIGSGPEEAIEDASMFTWFSPSTIHTTSLPSTTEVTA